MLQRYAERQFEAQASPPIPISYRQPPLQADWRQWTVVSLLLIAAALFLTWPWISGAVTIPWDGKAHFQAQAAFLAQSIHSGQSPFWAPYVFGGHPQIADPQSLIFSPGYVLLALLTPDPTFAMVDGVAFATLVFGAFGVIGFARDRRWHPAAAIVAALCFAFGGSAAWRIQHIGQVLSIAYFPWALWMLERSLRLSSARYGALSGLFAALMVLGPDQVSFLAMIVLSGFVVAHWLGGPGRLARMRDSMRPLVAGGIVGVLIVTIPTLMVLSFADGSNRSHIELEDAALGGLHPTSLITATISNIFGTIGPNEDFWGAPSQHWPFIVKSYVARNMANFYLGLLPLIGIIAWLASRAAYGRRTLILPVMFVLMIAYALGNYTPVFAMFYELFPGTDLFRRPADSLFIVSALGALLGGFGLDALIRRGQPALPKAAAIALALVMGASVVIGIGMAIWLDKVMVALPQIAVAGVTATAAFAALAYALRSGNAHPMRASLVLALCLTADLAWNIRPNDSTGLDPEIYEEVRPTSTNATLALLKSHIVDNETRRDRVELAGLGFEWPNLALVHKLETTLGYNPLRMGFYSAATGARDHVAGWDQRKFAPLMPGYRSPLANLLGLRFIATGVPIEQIDPAMADHPFPLIARTADGYVYENPDALPRVMVVPEAKPLDQDQLIRTGNWPGTDFRTTAYVEPSALPLPRRSIGGTAKITRYSNTDVEIEVTAPRGGVLVLNDVWHPWWFAEIDGMPAKILRANGVFRAVILPANAQKVAFHFEPLRGLIRRHLLKRGLITG